MYLPFGGTRWESGSTPTDFQFTGQRKEAGFGLYDYHARYYDPTLGRFVSADTVVPGAGNPQALNRFSYVFNNPLKYTDPSGHDPLDSYWEEEFRKNHNGRAPTDLDRQDRLFSLMFAGSGDEGTWTDDDWRRFSQNRNAFYGDPSGWNGFDTRGREGFASLTNRLAHLYLPNETMQFVQAFGLLFGGLEYRDPTISSFRAMGGPRLPHIQLGSEGWNPLLTEGPSDNPSHHYAGLFFAGFFYGSPIANTIGDLRENYGRAYGFPWIHREEPNMPDIRLGHIAVAHSSRLAQASNTRSLGLGVNLNVSLYDVSVWISEALR